MTDDASRDPHDDGFEVNTSTVIRSSIWSTLSSIGTFPVLAAGTIALTRILGARGIGEFALYTFVIGVISALADLGLTGSILRKGSVAAGQGDRDSLIRHVRAGTTWSLVQAPVLMVAGAFVFRRPDAYLAFVAGLLLAMPLLAPAHFAVMTSRLRLASQLRAITVVLSTGLSVGVAVRTHRPDLAFTFGMIGTNALTAAQVFAVPRQYRAAIFRPGRLTVSRSDVMFGLGNLVNGQLSSLVFTQSEVAFFRSTQAVSRGRYSVAQTVGARSTIVLDSLLGPMSAAMASAYGRGEEVLARAFRTASDFISLLLLATAPLGLVAVATLSGPVFGHGFGDIGWVAVPVTMASLFQSAASPILSAYYASKHILPMILGGASGAAVDLALAAVLVPRMGVVGAVMSALGAQLVFFAVVVGAAPSRRLRRLGAHHAGRSAVVLLFACVPAYVALLRTGPWGVGAAVALGLLWTLVGVRSRRLRGPSDLTALLDHLPRPLRRLGHLLVPID